MKKLFSIILLAALVVAGCDKYDDSDLQKRVSALENSMNQLLAYQSLLQKLDAGKTVTTYSQSGEQITLTFSDGNSLTFNIKGDKGDKGEIGAALTWDDLTEAQKAALKGETGAALTWDDLTEAQKAALKGAAGENGKTPTFKIENETWKVSYDDGATWTDVGSAIDRSLISAIAPNEAGDTLLITLADSTVIPVFYGEKEGYGFIVGGGRKCFSFYESLETECTGKIALDYTLSGDLQSIDDVKFVTNINFYPMSPDNPNGAVTIEPKDAKSGTITVKRQESKAEGGGANFDAEDQEYWMDFPGMNIDIMAVFPDGSVRVQQIRIMYEYVSLRTDEAYFYEDEYGSVSIDLPAAEGSVSFTLLHAICINKSDYELYDGEPFPQRPFSDCFSTDRWGSTAGTNSWNVTTSVGTTTVYDDGSSTIWYEYPVTFNYNANTSDKERRTWFDFMKKNKAGGSGGLIYWPIYVHQAHN